MVITVKPSYTLLNMGLPAKKYFTVTCLPILDRTSQPNPSERFLLNSDVSSNTFDMNVSYSRDQLFEAFFVLMVL